MPASFRCSPAPLADLQLTTDRNHARTNSKRAFPLAAAYRPRSTPPSRAPRRPRLATSPECPAQESKLLGPRWPPQGIESGLHNRDADHITTSVPHREFLNSTTHPRSVCVRVDPLVLGRWQFHVLRAFAELGTTACWIPSFSMICAAA
jgi:hypothetical protein